MIDDESTSGQLTESEIQAGGSRRTIFSLADVQLASARIDLAGILPKFAEWRAEDAKHRGGRKRVLDDRAILVACMLLRSEQSPMHITEMANIFWFRLDDEAKRELGISHVSNTGNIEEDRLNWMNRTWRSFHTVLDTMDPWPGERRLLTREERIAQSALRIQINANRKKARIDWFSNAMLEMTFKMQPRELRRQWGGALSIDQTAIKAPSQRGRGKNIPRTRIEVAKMNPDGTEKHRLILEPDADWYPKKLSGKERDGDGKKKNVDYDWAFAVDIVIQVAQTPGTPAKHPLLAMSMSLSKPNEDIGGATVRAMKSIQARGHRISRLTADLGYAGNLGAENYNIPLKGIGVPIVTDYKIDQKGIKGGAHGSIQVEGGHYCPGTLPRLLNASVDYAEDLIDEETWRARIDDRQKYRLRAKERPDNDGHRPMVCPAHGPGATVECPLREIHPKSSKMSKPLILKSNLPTDPDKICTQTSVDFGPEDGVEYEQLLAYGTHEWQETYKYDRNSIESFNDFVKSGPESIDRTADRRIRGRAAQQFIVTMLLMSANMRKISRFQRDKQREKPRVTYTRRRDTEGLSDYILARRRRNQKAAKKRELEESEQLRL